MKILFIGSRLFDDIAYYLKEKNIYSLITESNENAANLDLADEIFIVPRGMEEPAKIAIKENVDAIIPLIGLDLPLLGIAEMKEKIENEYNIPVIAGNINAIKLTSDKIKTKKFFKDIGINTAEYKILKENSYNEVNISFPCILKQSEGQAGKDIVVATSQNDLTDYFKTYNIALCEKFIKGSEISLEVLSFKGEYVALTPLYKGETSLDGTHTLNKTRNGPFESKNISNKFIKENALKIVKSLNSDGIYEVEFVYSQEDEKLYAIEVNARPNGTRYLTTATCNISTMLELVNMACGEFSAANINEKIEKYYSIEIPIGTYNGPNLNEPLKSFKNNEYIVHGPAGYQRITIRGQTKEKLDVIKEKLDIK